MINKRKYKYCKKKLSSISITYKLDAVSLKYIKYN